MTNRKHIFVVICTLMMGLASKAVFAQSTNFQSDRPIEVRERIENFILGGWSFIDFSIGSERPGFQQFMHGEGGSGSAARNEVSICVMNRDGSNNGHIDIKWYGFKSEETRSVAAGTCKHFQQPAKWTSNIADTKTESLMLFFKTVGQAQFD